MSKFLTDAQMAELEKAPKAPKFISDDDMTQLEKANVVESPKASLPTRLGLGLAEGVGEFVNIPAIPGAIERLGRTAYGAVTEPRQPGEGLFGKIGRVATQADKESVIPMPSVGETAASLRGFGRSILSPTKTAQIYDEELQAQKDYEKEYISGGARTLGQVASAIPGIVQVGKAIVSGAKALKPAVQAGKRMMGLAESADDIPKILKEVLQQTDGEIVEAILKRPEKVKELITNNKFTVDDLAKTLAQKLNEARETLGSRVGEFRKLAETDTAINLPRVEGLGDSLRAVLAKSNVRGVSMLPGNEKKLLDAVVQISDDAAISPQEALRAVDAIDAIVDYGNTGKSGSKFIQSADYALKGARKAFKDLVRSSSEQGKAWADADDAYSKFIEPTNAILRKLEGSQRNTFVSGLFNQNKEPVVEELSKSLGFVKDGQAGSYKQRFFDELADIKAAQSLKARDLKHSDPIADNIARIISKYEKFGEKAGAAAGGLAGMVSGVSVPLPGAIGGGGGAVSGGLAGKFLGGWAGRVIGERKANPMRILDLAMQSKTKGVADLAKDLKPVMEAGGPAYVEAVLKAIGTNNGVVQAFIRETEGAE